jgi:hypothetical protein
MMHVALPLLPPWNMQSPGAAVVVHCASLGR